MRSTTLIWVVMGHQNGHFMLIPQHHFAGKPVVASQNVGCFPRLEKMDFRISLVKRGV